MSKMINRAILKPILNKLFLDYDNPDFKLINKDNFLEFIVN